MHMSHKKRASTVLKSMGAAGLAAATIVSGLSFGAPAATASVGAGTLENLGSTAIVWKSGSQFQTINYDGRIVTKSSYEAAAREATSPFQVDVLRETGEAFRLRSKWNGKCLAAEYWGGSRADRLVAVGSCSSTETLFRIKSNSRLHNPSLNQDVGPVRYNSSTGRYSLGFGSGYEFPQIKELIEAARQDLAASVSKVNNIAKSAVISGTATPGAKVSIGSQEVEVNPSGAWSMTVTGLAAGKNDLMVIQKIDGTEHDQKTVSPEIVEGGTLVGVDQGPIELERGESTQVPFVVENRESRTDAEGTVVLTAPDGATFSEQDTVQGSWRRVGNTAWNASTSIPLTNGRLSNDNTTLTFDADWASERPADQQYRFMVGVTAGDETPEGSSAMEFDFSGTSSKGDFRAQGETTTTVADSENVAAPTGVVEFSDDVTEKAIVKGTGAEGATIDLFNGSTKIGTATVENGEWETTIDPIGAGTHTIRVQQTLGDDVQNVNVEADYRQAAEFTTADNVQFTDGTVTVSGRSSQGAIVKIVTGGKQVDEFTVTAADGTFTRELEGVGSGPIVLTMTAASRGGLETSDTLRAESPVKVEDLTVASHVRGGTFVPGPQAFTGQGTAGTTVTLNPFGFDPQYAVYDLTTTVNQFGEWTIARGLSDTPYRAISFKQTAQRDVVNQVLNYDLKPFREIGEPGDLMITNFKAGDFFTPGNQVFTGIATPGATITLNPFGFAPQYAQYNIRTTADTTTGKWEIRRGLGDTVYREFAVKQDPEAEGKVNTIEKITIAATGWVGAPADLTLATTDPTFTPGLVTFSGTATPGTVVTMYPFGDGQYADFTTTTVTNAVGNWEIKRHMGNQAFPAVFTQTDAGDKVDRIEHRITPAS